MTSFTNVESLNHFLWRHLPDSRFDQKTARR